MLSKSQQASFEAMVHEVAERVRAKHFPNTRALCAAYGREQSWSASIMHVIVTRYRLMSMQEWQSSFSGRFMKVDKWQCPRCQYRGKLKKIEVKI